MLPCHAAEKLPLSPLLSTCTCVWGGSGGLRLAVSRIDAFHFPRGRAAAHPRIAIVTQRVSSTSQRPQLHTSTSIAPPQASDAENRRAGVNNQRANADDASPRPHMRGHVRPRFEGWPLRRRYTRATSKPHAATALRHCRGCCRASRAGASSMCGTLARCAVLSRSPPSTAFGVSLTPRRTRRRQMPRARSAPAACPHRATRRRRPVSRRPARSMRAARPRRPHPFRFVLPRRTRCFAASAAAASFAWP